MSIRPRKKQDGSIVYHVQVRKVGHASQTATFDTKEEAKTWKAGVLHKMASGQEVGVARGKTTIKHLLEKFRDEEVDDRKGGRWERVRVTAWLRDEAWVKLRVGDPTVPQVLRDHVKARLLTVSAATVNRELNLLSGIFTKARKKWGLLVGENPVHAVARPPVRNRSAGQLWTPDKVEKLKAAARKLGRNDGTGELKTTYDYVVPAVLLGLATAMRLGEVCNATRSAVDLEERTLRLDDTKNGDARDVPLSDQAVEILKPLMAAAEAAGREELIPMSRDVLGLRFRQLRAAAELGDIRFHDTRHTAATMASKRLANLLELQAFTGHRSLQSLKRYYHPSAKGIAAKLS